MFMVNIVAIIFVVLGTCGFVKHFRMIDNQLEDKMERAYVRSEAINKCLAYGNVVAVSVSMLIVRMFVEFLV